eukprot:gene1236-1560_t
MLEKVQSLEEPVNKTINPHSYLVQVLDIAYAEIKGNHYNSIFNGVSGIIMVFDSGNASSIIAIDEWKELVKRYTNETKRKVPIALFANKSDLGDPVISPNDLDLYCKTCGYNFSKFTSCKKDVGIKDGIDKLIESAIEFKTQEMEAKKTAKIITIHPKPINKNNGGKSNSLHNNKKDKMLISQSLPNGHIGTSPGKITPTTISTSDTIRISEIQDITNKQYDNIKIELEDLLSKTTNNNRRSDLLMLEKQRANEYFKICNSIKRLIQPNLNNSGGGGINSNHNRSNKSFTKEMIHNNLEENLKKWNTLILNLHTEYKLEMKPNNNNNSNSNPVSILIKNSSEDITSDENNNNNNNNNNIDEGFDSNINEDDDNPSGIKNNFPSSLPNLITTISTESPIDAESHHKEQQQLSQSPTPPNSSPSSSSSSLISQNSILKTSNNNNDDDDQPLSPVKSQLSISSSSDDSSLISPLRSKNHHHQQQQQKLLTPTTTTNHHHKSATSSNKHKMGFGFRNNGKNSNTSNVHIIASSNNSIDTDNPISSSSSMTPSSSSSSISISPNHSPADSPTHSLSNSPVIILPNSYHLNVTMLPGVQMMSTSNTSNISNSSSNI